jgi:hypothetical protein
MQRVAPSRAVAACLAATVGANVMTPESRILLGLMARGLPAHVAQGVAGNMAVESRFDPGINEINPVVPGSRGGFGLNQWTGPRRRAFEAYAQERGLPLDDIDLQLDFTMQELQTTERGAFDRLMQTGTAADAARVYSDKFLRPGIPHLDRRIAEANRLAGMPMPAGQTAPQGGGMPNAAPSLQPQQNALAPAQDAPQQPQFNMLDMRQDPTNFMAMAPQMGQNMLTPFDTQRPQFNARRI